MKQNRYSLFHIFTATALLFAANSAISADNDNIYTYQVGNYTVSLLSEGQSEGKESILLNATPEQLKEFVPSGSYATAINTFLVQTSDQTILIDTGFGKKLFTNLQALGVSPEKVNVVLLTHMHGDHIGGLLRDDKPAFPNAKIYVAKQERDYWFDENVMKQQPEKSQDGFKNAQKALNAYGSNVETFTPGELSAKNASLLPGITPIAAFGHTPGHTAFMIESDAKRLMVWGDLAHAMAIQIPVPDVAVTYDVNPEMAVATRKAMLKYVAENKLPVAGMHIPYPAMGTVTAQTDVSYSFKPMTK